jgi:hypothetical protein
MKKTTLLVIFLLSYILGVLVPRPSARVENIGHVNDIQKKVLVGSSIVDHNTSAGNIKNLRGEAVFNNWTVLAKAGLTPEEVDFILSGSNYDTATIILGLYAILAPETYNTAKYIFYKGDFNTTNFFERELWINPYRAENKKLYTSLKKTIREKVESQGEYDFDSVDYAHAKFGYWGEFEKTEPLIKRNILKLASSKNTVILIAPTKKMVGDQIYDYTQKIKKTISESENKHRIIILEMEEKYLSEPWCLCGHLNGIGIKKLADIIWE